MPSINLALVAQDREETVGVTLELWSDPENDGDLSCCSAQAVREEEEALTLQASRREVRHA